jgi:hypothetical protein
MKTVRHWVIDRKGKRVFIRGAESPRGFQLKFESGSQAKQVYRSLERLLEEASIKKPIHELMQEAVDTMGSVIHR